MAKKLKKTMKKALKVSPPMNATTDKKSALMWYFISWHNKIHEWPQELKMEYAQEISKISAAFPIHDKFSIDDEKVVASVIKDLKIKHFRYEDGKFWMYNKAGLFTQEGISSTNLYALFIYLVDSVSSGLQDQEGFDFVKTAKLVIKLEAGRK